ncbi:hypothetical protein V9K67_22265 [Paraflavisolibacter sp. H34]|uniref:hypothetical protein n=1 Tax=Huijunlia imazamoxiresistens TaxID=3127457 RepID=UPI0030166CED
MKAYATGDYAIYWDKQQKKLAANKIKKIYPIRRQGKDTDYLFLEAAQDIYADDLIAVVKVIRPSGSEFISYRKIIQINESAVPAESATTLQEFLEATFKQGTLEDFLDEQDLD